MRIAMHTRRNQTGAYLLEALIGILIFSFGILGIVGLQAQAIRFTNEAEFRAEAVYQANALISQMWADNRATLQANYSSPGGPRYLIFKDQVLAAFQGALSADPVVSVDNVPVVAPPLPAPPSKTSNVVQVEIFWTVPGDPLPHNYTTTGVIGQNN